MSENHKLTGRQIAAARALAGLGQAELAQLSRVSVPTLRRMESSPGAAAGLFNNVDAVKSALESAGVSFLNETPTAGAGVRLRKP